MAATMKRFLLLSPPMLGPRKERQHGDCSKEQCEGDCSPERWRRNAGRSLRPLRRGSGVLLVSIFMALRMIRLVTMFRRGGVVPALMGMSAGLLRPLLR